MYSYGSPHMAAQKQDDQLERTFSSYVRIRDVVLKTYLGRWTIGRSGERGSGISALPARYDDDDDKSIVLPFFFLNLVLWYQSLFWSENYSFFPSFFFSFLFLTFFRQDTFLALLVSLQKGGLIQITFLFLYLQGTSGGVTVSKLD